ncbi:MAG: transglycosylase domain-containing protein [Clostridiales bacterium]|nr:transglycosylase domain-containing protein [Candidatus Cacconaster stercorequi]
MDQKKNRKSSKGFSDRVKMFAPNEKETRTSARGTEGNAQREKNELTPRQKRNRRRKIGFWVGTICLVAVLTIAIFAGIFMFYINHSLKGNVEVDMSEYDMSVSTELYYQNPKNDKWVMYQTLYASENRRLVSGKEISDYLRQAAIAIEDKRFNTHHGVDWHGTMRAIASTLLGRGTEGGSTITQQMIKNVTGDKDETVKRKITEIYRALELEKRYDKDEILDFYLNAIYLGNSCYGVETASDMYFNKHAKNLTLAESACLIAITNNPSRYDPLYDDWTLEQNRGRQVDVLDAMLNQGMIDQETHDAAVAEEVVFTNGYTNLGNKVKVKKSSKKNKNKNKACSNSYFTDQVIDDVAEALVKLNGLTDDPEGTENGRTAKEKGADLVYSGGYKIYTTQNPNYQSIAEKVFASTDYANLTDSSGQPLQAAITLMDPHTGDVLAMVGGTGTKEVDRGWNWATSARQCGSAIKPISTYAPAMDDGTISAASSIDDYPIMMNGSAYPSNSHGGYRGMTTVQTAVIESLNTCAVRVNLDYGVTRSYNFMTDKLGFTTLTETDSQQVGNMALGGLTYGVTTEEMAAAYGIFVNDGVYTAPRTFVRVEDADGNVILENKTESHTAIKETTAYLMRDILSDVITQGTGYEAYFSGMSMGGKTGTTDEERDRYFVGFTPYYSAAVWCGYQSNEIIEASGNPCADLWEQVMSKVHEKLDDPGFHDCDGLTTVSVCMDSGRLATDACSHDVRGSRVRTVTVAADTAPDSSCNCHESIKYCTEGKHVATEYCPKDSVKTVSALRLDRDVISGVSASDMQYSVDNFSKGDLCPAHKKAATLPDLIDNLINGKKDPGKGEDIVPNNGEQTNTNEKTDGGVTNQGKDTTSGMDPVLPETDDVAE